MSEAAPLDLRAVPLDRYPAVRVLAHAPGGFQAIARDRVSAEPVFIKARGPGDASRGARLRQEAAILAELSHPQIPALVEAATDESLPAPYIITAFQGGSPYPDRWLETYSQPRMAAQICQSALEPLAYAHNRGILHRDIKPGNLAVRFSGRTALLDFELGVATRHAPEVPQPGNGLRSGDSRLTSEGVVVGTADFISPERACGELGTAGSDIYSMGIVLYKLLYGRLPFRSGCSTAVAKQHVTEIIDFSDEGRNVPEALMAVIDIATQKDPAARYESAAAMAEDLTRYLVDTAP